MQYSVGSMTQTNLTLSSCNLELIDLWRPEPRPHVILESRVFILAEYGEAVRVILVRCISMKPTFVNSGYHPSPLQSPAIPCVVAENQQVALSPPSRSSERKTTEMTVKQGTLERSFQQSYSI